MKRSNQAFQAVVQGVLKSPFLWGGLGIAGFYAMVFRGPLALPLVERYFTKHPVEYMETAMFAVGLAALLLKVFDTLSQRATLSKPMLGPLPNPGQPAESCDTLLARLDRLPNRFQMSYLGLRLRAAIEHVRRYRYSESFSDELKFLADGDVTRSQAGYGLFRVIVWAIPILGFLGTVIGITMALNSVDLQSPDQSMLKVLNGLGLKFDTTALALTLSMVLMFTHFIVERMENSLLEMVDQRAEEELAGRFPMLPAGADGQLAAVRQMAETMLQAAEVLVQRQTELWQASMDAAAARWTQMANSAGERLHASLSSALTESLKQYAQHFAAIEQASAEHGRKQWDEMRQLQAQSVHALTGLQTDIGQQVEVLRRAVEATGDVCRLEDALNRNLTALAGAKHFEQTVLSLAAALNLLGARLAETPNNVVPVKLEPSRRTAQAA